MKKIESIITSSEASPQKIIFPAEQIADLDELTAPNDARIVNFNSSVFIVYILFVIVFDLGIYAIYILSVRGIIKYAIVLKSLIQVVFVKIVLVGLRHFRLMKIVIN